jgi:hypothetical protein
VIVVVVVIVMAGVSWLIPLVAVIHSMQLNHNDTCIQKFTKTAHVLSSFRRGRTVSNGRRGRLGEEWVQ